MRVEYPQIWAVSTLRLSLFRMNARLTVRQKCHPFGRRWYQLGTLWMRPGTDASADSQRLGGLSASMYLLTVSLWIPNPLAIRRIDAPIKSMPPDRAKFAALLVSRLLFTFYGHQSVLPNSAEQQREDRLWPTSGLQANGCKRQPSKGSIVF